MASSLPTAIFWSEELFSGIEGALICDLVGHCVHLLMTSQVNDPVSDLKTNRFLKGAPITLGSSLSETIVK